MNLDDPICLCYHVSLRKLLNFATRERPGRPSGMSECLGAGTGCGWCIPILSKIQQEAMQAETRPARPDEAGPTHGHEKRPILIGLPDSSEKYAQARKDYLKSDVKNAF